MRNSIGIFFIQPRGNLLGVVIYRKKEFVPFTLHKI